VLVFALGENLGYRQLLDVWRLEGFWQLVRNEIVVGVAVKFAYVPPTATTPKAPRAATVRRTLFVPSAFHWSI
jgi:hypothetical protein